MPKTPLISIIIPCFNEGRFINECLNSIHQQSYPNYEIIVVNDGSTDTFTNKVIHAINHPRIKVIETQNQGVSAARNTAIKNSSGKYILPLDADDKIGTNFIEQSIQVLESNKTIKVVSCTVALFGKKRGIIDYGKFSFEKLLAKNLLVVSSIFRRTDFDKTKGFNPNMKEGFEDWDFWISLLKTGGKVHKLTTVGFYYRIKTKSRNSTLTTSSFKKLRRQIYENHKESYSKYFVDPMLCFEYELIKNSKEYSLGTILLKPLRKLYSIFS
nr:glycosyltransferase family A protein [uncultured Draconibacterium sp.]